MYPTENPHFFDVLYNKSFGANAFSTDFKRFVLDNEYQICKPLQYSHYDTQNFGIPKVFLLKKQERFFKGRITNGGRDIQRIVENLEYATKKELPVAKIIEIKDPFLILNYLEPDPELEYPTQKVGKIHSILNHNVPFLKDYRPTFFNFVNICAEKLEDKSVLEIINTIPTEFLPVFDHQDIGIHNLVFNQGDPWLMDEEAFGILPFGYSLHRALYGREGYSICNNDNDRGIYLAQFSVEKKEYYLNTKQFWDSFLKLRSATRAKIAGNHDLSKKLMSELKC